MKTQYSSIKITAKQAAQMASSLYGIKGDIHPLPGELDFNFKLTSGHSSYILKISRPEMTESYLKFQQALLDHVAASGVPVISPAVIPGIDGDRINRITDANGDLRLVRLLSWIDGRLLSAVTPHRYSLLHSLGRQAGLLTKALQGFDHEMAHRQLSWDVAQADWTCEHNSLFPENRQEILAFFQQKFQKVQNDYQCLRKSVVHNDVNDNNVVVTGDLLNPEVKAIIDYGDAVHTQTVNDLAVAVAYAVMNKPDVLAAALPVVQGYHREFVLQAEELSLLHTLVAMRLVISVTHSAVNRLKEPDNRYLLISENAAWDVLEKWKTVDENLACYSFRNACGFSPHPREKDFSNWALTRRVRLQDLVSPKGNGKDNQPMVQKVDLGAGSTWLGHAAHYTDNDYFSFKLQQLQKQHENTILAGGYLEYRPCHSTGAFRKEGANGPEYRTAHLGIDFWVAPGTGVYTPFDGTVFSLQDNGSGGCPTIILAHRPDNGPLFYSMYRRLDTLSLQQIKENQPIEKGTLIGHVGPASENGGQVPHLHFQIMLDMAGNRHDFPETAFPAQLNVWKSICPDPNIFFKEPALDPVPVKTVSQVLDFRKNHLGKSLSLAYDTPLRIVRGEGAFLMDDTGRRYLDTVNNVAHAGHEHPRVVKAGQEQMAVLNTNTRYLHDNINRFAGKLLKTFPPDLSVVHFVNSGSEANELALRMTKAFTGQKDMIAVEIGYHGNTSGCIDVSSYKFDGRGGKGAPEHTHIVPLPDSFRGLYRGEKTGPKYAAHVKEQVEKIHALGRGVAGFICESIISCGGQIELPEGYLKTAYTEVRNAGGLCIADEVQVGCGRLGHAFWGFELHGVVPDIVTIGKPIGNGHPLAAVVCTRAVADAFANGMEYFNTFGGNPVSCAIGLEVLRVIEDEKLRENALEVGSYLKDELKKLQHAFPVIGDVRGQGLFLGFELVDENKRPLGEKAGYLANRMQELGILMSTDGGDQNVLKIKPPAVFSKDDADELLFRLETVLSEDFMKHVRGRPAS